MRNNYRWSVCALLFFATTINYLDRQVFGLLKPLLEREFNWTESDYSYLVIAFQASYAIGLLSFGRVIDRIGTKLGYALCMAVWSAAAAGHALVGSTAGFGVVRAVLGFGEAGNFPAAVKSVSEWFPKRERALAIGILTSGTSVGAILAPASVPWLASNYGWQATFIIIALTGGIWLVGWQLLYRMPAQHERPDEDAATEDTSTAGKSRWVDLLGVRRTWIIIVGKFMTDPIWYFMLFWLPSYFADRFGLDLTQLGLPLMIVYLATSVGSVGGGWLSSKLISLGWTAQKARQGAMLAMALCVLPLILSAWTTNMWVAVALLSLAAAAHQGWSANLFTTAADNFPRSQAASVTGIGGTAGSIGGMLFPLLIGAILDHYKALGQVSHGYDLLFVGCGCTYLASWISMQLMGAGRAQTVSVTSSSKMAEVRS